MKKSIIILVFIVNFFEINAQQDSHFTQYFDNTLFINPAYAGSKGVMNVTGIHREQWVGFEGRPQSSTLSIHSPLKYESIGLGLTMVNDRLGPMNQTLFYGDVSYSLRFKNKKSKLSFGLKGGINLINIGTSGLVTTVDGDPKFLTNTQNRINPNFGVGILYHTPSFFIGASVPKFMEKGYDGVSTTNLEKRHYFGIIGGVIKLNPVWKLRPTAQVKMTENAPVSIDASVAAIYRDKLYLGAMYRLDAALGAFLQYQFTPQFRVGIATDFGTQKIRNYNYGTYEIMLSYDFVFKKVGIRSPRYF
jgi:type IX secretion system PorP/SprF family membrane protein